eukprot:833187-Lingulodinium_polyedra.AAC.1
MMAKRAVIDIINHRLHLCGPVSDFHTIKPPGDKLAPQPPAVALTTTEASAEPKGGTATECPPSQIHFED